MKKLYKILPLLLVAPLSACQATSMTFEKHLFAFGTECHFTLYEDTKKGEENLEALYQLLKKIDAYADAENKRDVVGVYDLNQTNNKLEISEDFFNILLTAQQLNDSLPLFNPLVGSLSRKWKDSLAEGHVLDPDTIHEELDKISMSSLLLERTTDRFFAQRIGEAKIDLGAMAKGYALDKCFELSRQVDCVDYLFNLGRSSIGLGTNSEGKTNSGVKSKMPGCYGIRIEELSAKYLYLQKSFISTSGNSEQGKVIDGQLYGHIINPVSGDAISNYDEVIVISEASTGYGALGDTLSTSLMMCELEEIKKIEADYGVGIIVIQDSNIYYRSESVKLYNANGKEVS